MAKNSCYIKVNGKMVPAWQSKSAIKLHVDQFAQGLIQQVQFYGDEGARKCADLLLQYSQAEVPVGKDEKASAANQKFKSVSKVAKSLNINAHTMRTSKGSYQYIQFRNANGTMGDRIRIGYNKKGNHAYEHSGGSLYRSGRVDSLRDLTEKRNIIGYKVSFDTRRTDPRSLVNNFNYAIKQHEDWALKHSVGKSNFLRDPYNAHRHEFLSMIHGSIKRAFGQEGKR